MLKQSAIQNIQNQSAISNTLTKFIITVVGICVFWLVIWNLSALYLIKTKKLFILDGGVPTLLVPANRTRIFCNGETIATYDRSIIVGITYSDTTAEVFFGNGNSERFVCE